MGSLDSRLAKLERASAQAGILAPLALLTGQHGLTAEQQQQAAAAQGQGREVFVIKITARAGKTPQAEEKAHG